MAIITDVRFAHPEGALADTLGQFVELEVSIIREAGTDPQRDVSFLRFDGPSLSDVQAALEDDASIQTVVSIPEFEDERLIGVEFEPGTKLLAPEVTAAGGYVLDARAISGTRRSPGWYERWLLPDHESIHAIWQHAREAGYEFEIRELHRQKRSLTVEPEPRALTDEQRETLVTAYELGYFTQPRETSLAELASHLDISPSAAAGRIKRGMSALVGGTLVVDEL